MASKSPQILLHFLIHIDVLKLCRKFEVKVQCSQRQQQNKESDLYNERERLKQELAEEKRAHAEIENYLKKHIEDLDGKVEYWMSKYEEDLEMKTTEVQETKSAKAAGLQKLDELSQTVNKIR
uniref:Uncharacterized protein n=1 Tax=Amphimedon queenslandica TaxID=400682 RepID=A0A1X7SK92_AMPQE